MTSEMLEAISEKVHIAWMEEKQRQGFADHAWIPMSSFHPVCRVMTCDKGETRHHADMLPYADLAEHIKEYDRATVRGVEEALTALGYQIVPAATQRTTPGR